MSEAAAHDNEATGPTDTLWTLTPEEYAATVERAAKINARAAKRGFTGRLEVIGTPREVTETDAAGLERTRTVVDTRITGEAPRYNGWVFLAAMDAVETEDGHDFVLRTAPGVEDSGVDRSTLVAGHCDHCCTTRRNRRRIYLVRHAETGQTLQVGSTCIKDFTGWAGRPVFISADELAEELGDFIGGFGRAAECYSPETVVAAAWAISRLYGWVPARSFEGVSTRARVAAYLYGTTAADAELRADVAPEIAAAQAKAKEIIPALLEGLEGDGDYVTNLKALLRARGVEDRHMGIVVSAVSAYERMVGDRVRRDAEAQTKAASEYAGTVGAKVELTGTVARLVPLEDDYGPVTRTRMLVIVECGAVVAKTITAAAWAFEVAQGDTVTVAGAVKAHQKYQGTKQTVLTRPRLIARTAGGQGHGSGAHPGQKAAA